MLGGGANAAAESHRRLVVHLHHNTKLYDAVGACAQVRYRDGRLVSTRGDKYIIENLSEDYDGGSRGKVKTKGATHNR